MTSMSAGARPKAWVIEAWGNAPGIKRLPHNWALTHPAAVRAYRVEERRDTIDAA
ncbi:MAG: hypothetical protein ACKOUR_01255 [Planctomycetota bacterium]